VEILKHKERVTMFARVRLLFPALLGAALIAATVHAADSTDSLKKGTPDLKSAGPLAFGPDGILFVGDPQGAAIFAIDTGDKAPAGGPIKVEKIDEKIAGMIGTDAKGILINAIAVNPASGNAYLSVSRGKQGAGRPAGAVPRRWQGQDQRSVPQGREIRQGRAAQCRLGQGPARSDHRPGLPQGPRSRGRAVERGIRFQPPVDPVPLQGH
jgi:hypothetical protein